MTDIRNTPIEPDGFYHIYNRGVNGETIFATDRNYEFFLEKLKTNLTPVCNVLCYCLLPNHFHLLVKIKSKEDLMSLVKVRNLDKAGTGLHSPKNIFSKQFSRVFNSYSQAYNKEIGRHGALIESPYKRKLIDNEEYLQKLVIYIHQNPQNHGLTDDFTTYTYSSYNYYLTQRDTWGKRTILDLFEDEENYIFSHKKEIDLDEFD